MKTDVNAIESSTIDAKQAPQNIGKGAYRIDPMIRAIMPHLAAENYEALKENIRIVGRMLAPLVIWKEQGILLDGHHRDRARDELIVEGNAIQPPNIVPLSFASKADAANWVLHHAHGTRQHFGPFQRVRQLVGNTELMELLANTANARMRHAEEPGASADPGSAEETAKVSRQIAKLVRCSETTAKEAIAVCRHGDFVPAVLAGDITAHSAYRAIRGHAHRQQVHAQIEQNLPEAHREIEALVKQTGTVLGKVHHSDVLIGLRLLPDGSVSAVITSPPYPLKSVRYPNWEYGKYPAYLTWMAEVYAECKRILMPGGKLIVNFDNCNIPPEERVGFEVRHDCRRDFANIITGDLGMIFVDEIFWAKQSAVGTRPAIGTKGSPSGHRVNNTCEYVCIWAKEQVQKSPERTDVPKEQLIDLTVQEQYNLSMQLWMISPAKRSLTKHRAAFPDELARRLIRLYTFLGDTVVDPFVGSGTTCATAARMGRKFVGFDNAKQHIELAEKRIADALASPTPPEPTPDWNFERELKRARNTEKLKAEQKLRGKQSGKKRNGAAKKSVKRRGRNRSDSDE
jgi:modification methylase